MDRAVRITTILTAGIIAIVMSWIVVHSILAVQQYELNMQAEELLHVPVLRNEFGHYTWRHK
jgi:hypothetical protein